MNILLLILIFLILIFLVLRNKNNFTNTSINIITKKHKICVIISGQIRTNSCCLEYKDNIVADSFNNFFINDEFKIKYDYDIFISTDKIDIEKTLIFFGKEHIKNIYTSDDKKYLIPIKENILSYDYYFDKYIKKDFENYLKYPNGVYQYYRAYNALNMVLNYNDTGIYNYDYIIYTRPDMIHINDINISLKKLQEIPEILLCTEERLLMFVGRPNICKHILELLKKYGDFSECIDFILEKNNTYTFNKINLNNGKYPNGEKRWKFAPEFQMWEHLFNYFKNNKISPNNRIHNINMGDIYR